MGFLVRLLICIVFCGILLFQTVHHYNKLTALRLEIPKLMYQLQELEGENIALQFEIACFENPHALLELSKDPRFAHLRYPIRGEIRVIP